MDDHLIELRRLPGIARIEGLCLQSGRWDYPTVIETMAEVNAVSVGLFAITHADTLIYPEWDDDFELYEDDDSEPDGDDEADEDGEADNDDEPFDYEAYEQRFNATRAAWPDARRYFEAIGWDISDGKGNELVCAHWFARQIIAASFELVEGASFTPDGTGHWAGYKSDEPESEEAMAERLEREVAAFLARKNRS